MQNSNQYIEHVGEHEMWSQFYTYSVCIFELKPKVHTQYWWKLLHKGIHTNRKADRCKLLCEARKTELKEMYIV